MSSEKEELAAIETLVADYPDKFYVVESPWGDGTLVVAGNPDPHAGQFICDCNDIGEEWIEGEPTADDKARERAGIIIEFHNAVFKLLRKVKNSMTKEDRLCEAWKDANRKLTELAGTEFCPACLKKVRKTLNSQG